MSSSSAVDAPVTATLERMDPLRELLHWATRRQAVVESDPQEAQVLARFNDREAIVYEALAADPEHGSLEHSAQATACRRRAAELRGNLAQEPGGRSSTS